MKKLLLIASVFIALTVVSVAHAQQDITPPSLLDVRFEPETIDTSKGPATITVTVHVTDDLSGVRWVGLFFRKPDTTQKAQVEFRPSEGWSEIVEGDLLDGYHVATMTLPQYAAYGTWEMFTVGTEDNVGNLAWSHKPNDPEEAERGTDQWPVLFNGFAFAVGQTQTPQEPAQPARQLFIPSVSAN